MPADTSAVGMGHMQRSESSFEVFAEYVVNVFLVSKQEHSTTRLILNTCYFQAFAYIVHLLLNGLMTVWATPEKATAV